MRPVILIQNSKGGVGKSVVTMAVMDWLESLGIATYLVESDTSNSDCGIVYQRRHASVVGLDLDTNDGWMDLGNLAGSETDRTLVVNGASRNMGGVQHYGSTMQLVQKLRPIVTLWVLDTLEDSVSLLGDYLIAMCDDEGAFIGTVHVLCNEGKAHTSHADFSIYEESKVAERVRELNGATARFPKLAERLLRQLFTGERKTVSELAGTGPLGNRAEAQRWRGIVHRRFEKLLGKPR